MDPRRFSRLNLEGTPGNSRGGAELARGGGFSCNQTIFEIRIRVSNSVALQAILLRLTSRFHP